MSEIKRLSDEIGVYKISAQKRNPPKNYPLHWHEYYELEYILKGSGVYTINDIEYEVVPGSLFFLTPIDFASVNFCDEYATLLNISFSGDWVSPKMQQFLTEHAAIYNYHNVFLNMLFDEVNSDKMHKDEYIRHLLGNILIDIKRNSKKAEKPSEAQNKNDVIRDILSFIQLHFRESFTLDTVSEYVGLSPNYISKIFHAHTGKTYKAYLSDIRLNYAATLLINTKTSISEICFNCGFNSFAHFFRAFKRKYNCTPAQYRKDKT